MLELSRLTDPFDHQDIEWRVQRSGSGAKGHWCMVVPYVTNRAIQQRLDDVCRPLGWRNEYQRWSSKGVLCGISIWNQETSEWVTKWDGADETDIEPTKGGLSTSMKRAAVQWGLGRYLYKVEGPFFAPRGTFQVKSSNGKDYFTITDELALSRQFLGGGGDGDTETPPTAPMPDLEVWLVQLQDALTEADLADVAAAAKRAADWPADAVEALKAAFLDRRHEIRDADAALMEGH